MNFSLGFLFLADSSDTEFVLLLLELSCFKVGRVKCLDMVSNERQPALYCKTLHVP